METHISTTPFGRRPASLGQMARHAAISKALDAAGKAGTNAPAAVNKWVLFRTLTAIRTQLGVSDRSLAVLNALLSFHPETALSLPRPDQPASGAAADGGRCAAEPCELVVFPSNRQLCARAHGMAETTLRGHLAALVQAGLILRRDSPNGKRYALRRGQVDGLPQSTKAVAAEGLFSEAYGFDLTPLVLRCGEFEALHEEVERERRLLRSLRTRITLHRRDIAKIVALGLDEQLAGPWDEYMRLFMGLVTPLRQLRSRQAVEQEHAALAALLGDVTKTLDVNMKVQKADGIAAHSCWHMSNSKTDEKTNFEPSSEEEGDGTGALVETIERKQTSEDQRKPVKDTLHDRSAGGLPLGLVLEACPDLAEHHHAGGKIATWSAFQRAAEAVRPMMGISPDAWHEACQIMSPVGAAIAVAMILQRSEHSSEARAADPPDDGRHLPDHRFIEPPLLVSGRSVNGTPAIISAGGYLRALTAKARAGQFTPGPMLMALIGQRARAKRSGRG